MRWLVGVKQQLRGAWVWVLREKGLCCLVWVVRLLLSCVVGVVVQVAWSLCSGVWVLCLVWEARCVQVEAAWPLSMWVAVERVLSLGVLLAVGSVLLLLLASLLLLIAY